MGSGLLMGILWGVIGDSNSLLILLARVLLAYILMLVQIVVLAAVLCPLTIIYMFGIFMSGGISLWRLTERDYGGISDGEASNLSPAMDTLYYLALIQGVLFCYRFVLRYTGKRLVQKVLGNRSYNSELQVVSNYLYETRRGCEKDPSFAKGMNLITHGVDKIGSSSPVVCISGVKILYTAICIVERELEHLEKRWGDDYLTQVDIHVGQKMLLKHLVVSTSSSRYILQKLLEILDARGLHDRETRNQAAKIVGRVAYSINLEQFPGAIQHISSLIDSFEEYSIAEPYHRGYEKYLTPSPVVVDDDRGELMKDYHRLLFRGLYILHDLAANENNCRVMSDTPYLVSKIMAPVTLDLLHHTIKDHGAWTDVVKRSMDVIIQLTCARGETGAKLHHEISSCEEAINTLQRILCCNTCKEGLRTRAIQILGRLYVHTTGNSRLEKSVVAKKESSNREDFVRMLLDIFIHNNKYSSSIRVCAGKELSNICCRGGISDATIVMQTSGGDVVDGLAEVLVQDNDEICRQEAAEILESLCTLYTKDDKCLGKLKKTMINVLPKVLGEINRFGGEIHTRKKTGEDGFDKPETDIENQHDNDGGKIISSCSSHPQNDEKRVLGETIRFGEKTHAGKEVAQDEFSKSKATDLESHCDGTRENNELDKDEKGFQAAAPSIGSTELISSLLSFCGAVYDMAFITDFPPQLDASIFLKRLGEVVVKKSAHPTIENLLLCKAISKMIISMVKHNSSSFIKREDLESLIEALSIASLIMLDLDYSMVFRSVCRFKTRGTLASLVKQAKELHAKVPSTSVSG